MHNGNTEYIKSRHNSAIKEVLELKKRTSRDALGLAVIEGIRFVKEALSPPCGHNVIIKLLFASLSFSKKDIFADIEQAASLHSIRLIILPDVLFSLISETMNPQGLLAVIKQFEYTRSDIIGAGNGRAKVLLLDRIADPGNAGAMLRTAEAAAFSGAALSENCVDIYAPKTMRATMGSVLRIPFVRDVDLYDLIGKLRRTGFRVFASGAAAKDFGACAVLDFYNADIGKGDIALVIGSEADGVRSELFPLCDGILTIPMPGGAESLNAAVAAGILMYEFLRRDLIN